MSSSKNRKKKKEKSFNPRIILLVALIVAVLSITTFMIVDKIVKSQYYECTEYKFSYATTGDPIVDDLLVEYKYYRIYLHDDNTFTLKLLRNSARSTEEQYTGEYTKTNTRLTLKYDNFYEESFDDVIYTIEDNKLVRKQYMEIEAGTRYTVYQTFKK